MLIKVKIKLHTQLKYLFRTQKTQKAKWRCCWLSGSRKLLINSSWGSQVQPEFLIGWRSPWPRFWVLDWCSKQCEPPSPWKIPCCAMLSPGSDTSALCDITKKCLQFCVILGCRSCHTYFVSTFDTIFLLVVFALIWHHADFTEHFLQSAVHLFFFFFKLHLICLFIHLFSLLCLHSSVWRRGSSVITPNLLYPTTVKLLIYLWS